MKEIISRKKLIVMTLIVAILVLSITFAIVSETLKINGISKVDSAIWDIHFKSASMINKKGDAREAKEPIITNGGLNLTLKVGLRKPKDEITYKAVIVNEGDIDAEIESIEYPTLTEDQAEIIEFIATYDDGTEISKSQEINSGEEKIVEIVIRYKNISNESLLATKAYDVPLTFKINYIQKGFNTGSIVDKELTDNSSKTYLAYTDVLATIDSKASSFANSPIERGKIESIKFERRSNSTRTNNSWDASYEKDGSIIGYYIVNDAGLYDVVIESASNIYAPVDCSNLFAGFTSLKEIHFDNFKTDDTKIMSGMFINCSALKNIDVSSFDTKNVTNFMGMFGYCTSLTNINLTSFNTSRAINMSKMFYGCSKLITIDMSNLNTRNVTDMSYIFCGDDGGNHMSLKNIYLTGWNTISVTNMSYMFSGCEDIENLDVSSFDTRNVTNMSYMFNNCKSLKYLNLSHFNTQNVTNMQSMFMSCRALTNLDLSSFSTANVTSFKNMFNNCSSLINVNLSNFNAEKVVTMDYMFQDCSSLTTLNLSSFYTLRGTSSMFANCSSLKELKLNMANFAGINLSAFDNTKITRLYVNDQTVANYFKSKDLSITTIIIETLYP